MAIERPRVSGIIKPGEKSRSSTSSSQASSTSKSQTSSMWLPAGITSVGFPSGEHHAQLTEIAGFPGRDSAFVIRTYWRSSSGSQGPISIRFTNDPERAWINARNGELMRILLDAAQMKLPDGQPPDWESLTDALFDRWFKIQVGRKGSGAPYLTKIEIAQDNHPNSKQHQVQVKSTSNISTDTDPDSDSENLDPNECGDASSSELD